MTWSVEQVPSLTGKVAIVTGANAGLGFEAARVLAARGARVVLACRNVAKAQAAAARIQAEHTDASLDVRAVDLSALASVEAFAEGFVGSYDRLDLLGLNAGVMGIDGERSVDGFEMQFAANHLGHFALAARLMLRIRTTAGACVVSHSSLAHRQARTWGNPRDLEGYERWGVYAQTKLANLLFALELDRRFKAANVDAVARSAHPGMSATELGQEGTAWTNRVVRAFMPYVTQSAAEGALPFVRALTDASLAGGTFVGPHLRFWGNPVVETPTRYARDAHLAAGLWEASVAWTGCDPFAS